MQMSNKHNLVLYVDKELVEKSREIGFNLSKTFENHLKHLLTQFSQVNSSNNARNDSNVSDWWAGPDLNRRPLARKANVLTKLDDRPSLSIKRFCSFLVFANERCFQSFPNDLLATRSSMMSSGFCNSASFALTSTCFPRYFLV